MTFKGILNKGLTATASLLLVLLMACGQPPATNSSDKITLEFWTLQLLTFEPMLTEMFSKYERLHPNIKIKWVDVPFSEGEKRTLTAMLSPTVPDVVNLNPDFSAILASRGALANMNDYLTADEQKTYLPVVWDAVTLWSPDDTPPFTFGLPWYLTSKITIINQSLLKEADQHKSPESFAELITLAKALKATTGHYALMPNIAQSGNFLKALFYNQIPVYNDGGKAILANDQAVDFLNQWIMLFQNDWMPSDAITEGPRGAVDRFQSGKLALLMTGANFLNIVKENAPAIYRQTAVAPQFIPVQSNAAKQSVDFSTMLLAVPKRSAHIEEAVNFARFMTNAANQLRFAHEAPILPSVTKALEDDFFQPTETEISEQARKISAKQLLNSQQTYQIRPNQKKLNDVIDYYVQLALLGKLDAQSALSEAETKMNRLLD